MTLAELLRGTEGYLRPAANGELVMRCPRCGDSSNPSHGHLYARTEGKAVWHCHRCGSGGRLSRGILSDMGLRGEALNAAAAMAGALVGPEGPRAGPPKAREWRIPKPRKKDVPKLWYLMERGVELSPGRAVADDLRRLRAVADPAGFLEMNGLETKCPDPEAHVGFLSSNGDTLLLRRVDGGEPRWWTQRIAGEPGEPRGFWHPRTRIDSLAAPLRVGLAEGVFSTLGAMREYGGGSPDGGELWMAALGKRFAPALEWVASLGWTDLRVELYLDEDVSNGQAEQMLAKSRALRALRPRVEMCRNANGGDFGDPEPKRVWSLMSWG